MTIPADRKIKVPLRVRVIDGLLLVATIVLGGAVLLTLQEPMFNIGAIWVVQNIEGAIHQAYNMSVLYNIWLFIGGGIWLAFVIGSIEYYPKRFGRANIRRWLLRTCVIEGILILLNVVIGNMSM